MKICVDVSPRSIDELLEELEEEDAQAAFEDAHYAETVARKGSVELDCDW